MRTNYNPSVNIVRDAERKVNYITTDNGRRSAFQIINDIKKGLRSFLLIGSYGTGKSSFLWAFQQSLLRQASHFALNYSKKGSVKAINLVGSFISLKTALQEYFNCEGVTEKELFSEIYNHYRDIQGEQPLLLICVDEFGKYLEYACKHEPESELYFIQQLLEFINNPERNIVLLSTVHQNIDAYGFSLSNSQKQEWTKIKGRFRELTFNEPVEQLLFLAASHLSEHRPSDHASINFEDDVEHFTSVRAFNSDPQYVSDIAAKLYPLDLFAANVLTLALQRYGQNERSLFSFLESTDQTGIKAFNENADRYYHLGYVYQYLVYNFYSYINSPVNRDLPAWRAIQSATEAAERRIKGHELTTARLIQAIGLLNIFAAAGAVIDRQFLLDYAVNCMGMPGADEVLSALEHHKIVHYRNYSRRYILFEGTDLDIQLALFEAANKVDQVVDVTGLINKYFQFPPVIAKSASYSRGTPRLFEYLVSALPQRKTPKGEIDGYINLVFNEKISETELLAFSQGQEEAILYGYYRNSKHIKDLLFEVEKTKKVIEENMDDQVAVHELNNIIQHQQNLLTHKIQHSFYSNQREIIWIYRGAPINIGSQRALNETLSMIVNEVYNQAPVFKNELVNKHKISPSIHAARRNYIRALANDWDKPGLGFPSDKYPPEKTIYLTLLENNGIVLLNAANDQEISVDERNDFHFLWNFCMAFLDSSKAAKRNIKELADLLALRPFKLKQGLIDFWIASFIFIKRNDIALFYKGTYVANLNDEVLELLIKYPADHDIKAFDIGGVRLDLFNNYRTILQQSTKSHLTNKDFVETIRPFLTFYKGLPEYAKNTQRLEPETIRLRDAIFKARDPEQTFFDAFPNALGYSMQVLQNDPWKLQEYVNTLQEAIRELRNCYNELVNRVEMFIAGEVLGTEDVFPKVKTTLQARFQNIRKHLLLHKQRIIIQRINSELDDRGAWINSLVQGVMGITLEKFNDDSEWVFYDKCKFAILELDSLTSLSLADHEEGDEQIVQLDISSFSDGLTRKLLRIPNKSAEMVSQVEDDLKKTMSQDRTVNIAALTKLLKELIEKE
jgi:hypothetical protein